MEASAPQKVDQPSSTPDWSPLEEGEHLVDIGFVPDGSRLRLVQSGDDFAILLDHNELMSTDVTGSEQTLARLACAELTGRAGLQMLIGGYGMGFTLRAALETLGPDAEVTVSEIAPKVVEWARGPMRAITNGCLDDSRVRLVQEDVAILIEAASEGYDCILLDVDNGPEGLTRGINDWLYSNDGLAAARDALRPEGILAIWSAWHDDRFAGRLARCGFAVTVIEAERVLPAAADNDASNHVIIMAFKR